MATTAYKDKIVQGIAAGIFSYLRVD
jgi:N-acetylmuramoyl-L-alanine amidase